MALAAKTVLDGKYRLVRELGRGAMGAVWHAEHLLTERHVAVKVIADPNAGPDLKARMLREARACGRVASPHVVQILDVGQTDDGSPFLVMELLDGESLDSRLRGGRRLSDQETATIGVGVAKGLAAAHKLGVVHRDLKPANIFLHKSSDGDRIVKVVDFGISKVSSADELGKTDTGKVVGSPAYMSPEQAEGSPTLDARTDLWSLGVVLYEMLAGELPFRGETPWALVAEILRGATPDVSGRLRGADQRIVDQIEQCLVRDRDARVASAEEIVAALSSVAGTASTLVSSRPDARVTTTDVLVDPTAETMEGGAIDTGKGSGAEGKSAERTQERSGRGGLVIGALAVSSVALAAIVWSRGPSPTTKPDGVRAATATLSPSSSTSADSTAAPPASASSTVIVTAAADSSEPVVTPGPSASASAKPTVEPQRPRLVTPKATTAPVEPVPAKTAEPKPPPKETRLPDDPG